MKQVSEIVQGQDISNDKTPSTGQLPTRSTDKVPPKKQIEPLPARFISKLFVKLKTEYGTAFISQFDDQRSIELAKATWAERLHDCTPDEIRFGLEQVGDHFVQFPPNVHQFRQLCKSYKPSCAAHRQFLPAPEIKKADPETAKKYRDQILKESGI